MTALPAVGTGRGWGLNSVGTVVTEQARRPGFMPHTTFIGHGGASL